MSLERHNFLHITRTQKEANTLRQGKYGARNVGPLLPIHLFRNLALNIDAKFSNMSVPSRINITLLRPLILKKPNFPAHPNTYI
jgi:hypothetical protein